MIKWDYNLSIKGKYLRELIQLDDSSKENGEKILNQIIVCCQYLQTHLLDKDRGWYEDELEDMIEDCEDTKYYLDEFDEDNNEDNINDALQEFYDLMDEMRVWIPF